ncbi:MAG: hypothetical protein ACXW14_04690 [Burkholderiaceae bacterium]
MPPSAVCPCEFVEWTPDNHLRHSRLIGLRPDKPPQELGASTQAKNARRGNRANGRPS